MPVFIFLLLFAKIAFSADQAHAAEGVYFLSQPGRVLKISGNAFRSLAYEGTLRTPGEISGWADFNNGHLRLQNFDGKAVRFVGGSAAVIDGHLWIGVMSRIRGADGQDGWHYTPTDPELFGLGKADLPAQRVHWRDGTWTIYLARVSHYSLRSSVKIGEIDASHYTKRLRSGRLSVARTLSRKRGQIDSKMAVNLTVDRLGPTGLAYSMHLATGSR
jgi:hypothetical protein